MLFALPAMSGPAVVGEYSVIEQMVKARARQPVVARFAWIDNSGHPVAADGPDIKVEAPDWFVKWLDLPVLEEARPVVVGGEKYGSVTLRLNPAVSINRLWRGFWEQVGSLVLGTGLSIAVTLVVLHSGVQPLRALAASARRFGQGEYGVRVTVEGPSETAQCVQAFNSMASNIESLLGSLSRSEEKNRLLAMQVEQSNDAIFSHDQRGVVTSWNRGAARLYGYKSAETIGRPLSELDLWDSPVGKGGDASAVHDHQRHPRLLEDRGRPARARAGAVRAARDAGRNGQDARAAQLRQGARAELRDPGGRAGRPDRRHRPARPDPPQPGRQRDQVHRAGRGLRARRRRGGHARHGDLARGHRGHRHRHSRRQEPRHLRRLRAGRRLP